MGLFEVRETPWKEEEIGVRIGDGTKAACKAMMSRGNRNLGKGKGKGKDGRMLRAEKEMKGMDADVRWDKPNIREKGRRNTTRKTYTRQRRRNA